MKAYSTAVLEALTQCLRHSFHYKRELRSFLVHVGVPGAIVSELPWGEYKWAIVRALVERLSTHPATGTPIIERLLDALIEQDPQFPRLRDLADGRRLAADARDALQGLRDLLGKENTAERAARARGERRTDAERAAEEFRARKESLRTLADRFEALCNMTDHKQRGLDFQTLLRDLFSLYDLDPRGSFARPGEQTDGSMRIDNLVLLIEARWTDPPTAPSEVRDFRCKVHDKLDNTLGLMVSMAGFTDEAVAAAAGGGRILLILMDGTDLAPVFQGVTDLRELLSQKLRAAAEKGRPLHRWGMW